MLKSKECCKCEAFGVWEEEKRSSFIKRPPCADSGNVCSANGCGQRRWSCCHSASADQPLHGKLLKKPSSGKLGELGEGRRQSPGVHRCLGGSSGRLHLSAILRTRATGQKGQASPRYPFLRDSQLVSPSTQLHQLVSARDFPGSSRKREWILPGQHPRPGPESQAAPSRPLGQAWSRALAVTSRRMASSSLHTCDHKGMRERQTDRQRPAGRTARCRASVPCNAAPHKPQRSLEASCTGEILLAYFRPRHPSQHTLQTRRESCFLVAWVSVSVLRGIPNGE